MSMKSTFSENLVYFSSNSEARLRGNETLEVIIPDRYPDAREILLVTGQTYTKVKEQNGYPLLQATMEVFALVESVENSLYTISCEIPVVLRSGLPVENESCIFYAIREAQYDAAIANSRKLTFSGQLGAAVTQYHKKILTYAASLGEDTVSIPAEWNVIPRSLAVTEVFDVNDDLLFPAGKGDVAGIFRKDAAIEILEKKLIHEKLIVRAHAALSLSYITGTGKAESIALVLPFTHVFELPGMDEEEICKVLFQIEKLSLSPQNKEGEWFLSIALELRTEILCYHHALIQSVNDGYGLKENITLQKELISLPKEVAEEVGTGDAVCRMQFTDENTQLDDVSAFLSCPITYLMDDGRLRAVVNVTVVAIGSNQGRVNISKEIVPVECFMSSEAASPLIVCSIGKIQIGACTAGNCDVTIPVRFWLIGEELQECCMVTEVTREAKDLSALPAFVLTEIREGEQIYDLGRRCNAHPEDIREANRLDADAMPVPGTRVLVPVCNAV